MPLISLGSCWHASLCHYLKIYPICSWILRNNAAWSLFLRGITSRHIGRVLGPVFDLDPDHISPTLHHWTHLSHLKAIGDGIGKPFISMKWKGTDNHINHYPYDVIWYNIFITSQVIHHYLRPNVLNGKRWASLFKCCGSFSSSRYSVSHTRSSFNNIYASTYTHVHFPIIEPTHPPTPPPPIKTQKHTHTKHKHKTQLFSVKLPVVYIYHTFQLAFWQLSVMTDNIVQHTDCPNHRYIVWLG